jgi:lysophospholipase L1-like esterase
MNKLFLLLTIVIATMGMTATAQHPNYSPIYDQRASLFEVLPVDSTSIVFLGNSITQGCEWHELFGIPEIKNRGISGDIVDGMRERIEPIVAGKPRKIFIMCGINDISHNLPADSIASNFAKLVDYIHAETPSTKIYIQSILPIHNGFKRYKAIFGKENVVPETNKLLEQYANTRGFTWINLYDLFIDSEGNLNCEYTNDGLHLLGKGYLVWRDAIMPYVTE